MIWRRPWLAARPAPRRWRRSHGGGTPVVVRDQADETALCARRSEVRLALAVNAAEDQQVRLPVPDGLALFLISAGRWGDGPLGREIFGCAACGRSGGRRSRLAPEAGAGAAPAPDLPGCRRTGRWSRGTGRLSSSRRPSDGLRSARATREELSASRRYGRAGVRRGRACAAG